MHKHCPIDALSFFHLNVANEFSYGRARVCVCVTVRVCPRCVYGFQRQSVDRVSIRFVSHQCLGAAYHERGLEPVCGMAHSWVGEAGPVGRVGVEV